MNVSHDYMLSVLTNLEAAYVALGAAQSNLSLAISTNNLIPPDDAVDQSSYWPALQTYIATSISDVATAISNTYYYPEQQHP